MFAHFGWVIYENTCPQWSERSAVFDQKWHDPHAPPSLFTRSCLSNSFVSQMKKLLKGKHFANLEKVKQKTAEALKGIKIDEFKNCF